VNSKGIEGAVTAAIGENWDLYLAASWLDSEATRLQSICGLPDPNGCEGVSLFWAPDFAGAAVLNGSFPTAKGAIVGSLEATWDSERGGGFERLASTMIDSYTEFTLRVGYESDQSWSVTAYIENLTDEFTYDGLNNNGGIVPSHFFGHRRPRTAGVSFNYSWE
jgi:iron complex outermembrane receptor protein